MSSNHTPLISPYIPSAAKVYRDGYVVKQSELLASAIALADHLPPNSFVLNLCEDRFYFLLSFMAALINRQTNILPPDRKMETVTLVAAQYPDNIFLVDTDDYEGLPNCLDIRKLDMQCATRAFKEMPQIRNDHIAAIAFTSGSTGAPKANNKTWQTLSGTAQRLGERFKMAGVPTNIVATVPSQHMYGLEMTVMMALQANCIIHCAHPFFPADIVMSLTEIPEPRVLVSTPVHLRALMGLNTPMPVLERVVSATAPLSTEIAVKVASKFNTSVDEIYGCTEAGSIATRNSESNEQWQLLEGVRLEELHGEHRVRADHFSHEVVLNDVIEMFSEGTFKLLGRSADMLNVGGKRASLADLNHKLLSIEGVTDGVVFLPDQDSTDEQRPAALVVSDTLTEKEILCLLAKFMDPVFLPRPLRRVSALPRNDTGKIPLKSLKSVLAQAQNELSADT